MNTLLICLQLFMASHIVAARRGPPARVDEQPGGDVVEMLPQRQTATDFVMHNALQSGTKRKWNRYRTASGKYIVPYTISGHYSRAELNNITAAMRMLESNTCILFRKRGVEKDYIDIQNTEQGGCHAPVGRFGGRGVVMLEASKAITCLDLATVLHELLHVIGLNHEHVREDRDKYVEVHWENVKEGFASQFIRLLSDQEIPHGVEYDYLSIMHYAKDASAKPGTITLETLNSAFQDIIGKVQEPSVGDYMKVCNIYNCNVCMGEPTPFKGLKPPECQDKRKECSSIETGALDCYDTSIAENCCGTCTRILRSQMKKS